MLAHAALFLGHTTTMDDMSLRGFRAGDAADSRHRTPFGKEREDAVLCLGRQVKMSLRQVEGKILGLPGCNYGVIGRV